MNSRQPEASTSAHPFERPPVAHSPLSTSPTRYSDHDHLEAHAQYERRRNQPARDGTGSSAASPSRTGSRGLSPARGGSGDSTGGVYRPHDTRKGGSSAPPSRQNSGDRGYASVEDSEAGLAGRGAGGQGLGRGGGLPVLNTHMLPGGYGLLSPASPSYPHHASDPRASLLPQQRSGSHSHSPSQPYGPPSTTSTRATPSPTFPASHSNSTISSHSHGFRSPIATTFAGASSSNPYSNPTTASNSPFAHPPSRPSSSASHSQQSHARSRSQNPSADGHSRDSGSRSRGNSTTSVDGRESERGGREDGTSGGRLERREKDRSRKERMAAATCAKCELPMTGQFVRALGTVYHLDCFRCMVRLESPRVTLRMEIDGAMFSQDCGKMVASKFFPIDAPDGSGRQVPLCETDYFRRLNLLCAKCGQALRGSYITALGAPRPAPPCVCAS